MPLDVKSFYKSITLDHECECADECDSSDHTVSIIAVIILLFGLLLNAALIKDKFVWIDVSSAV